MASSAKFHVVIAGGGVAALETALALRDFAADEVSVELVAPDADFVYRPLAVTEPFRVGDVKRFPLDALARIAGAGIRFGAVAGVDPEGMTVRLRDGSRLGYDALVLAIGARPRTAVHGALTFRGVEDSASVAEILSKATAGELRRIVFALPSGAAWPLPLYELALLTANHLAEHMTRVEVAIATPEDRPLSVFGPAASDAMAELLELRGITTMSTTTPVGWREGRLLTVGSGDVDADAVIALPQLQGLPLPGIPQDENGFVATDEFGWVLGTTDVYAAGDITQFPLKQGGIATQQADAAASAIAADAGAAVRPCEFRPVLRGLLLTGFVSRFLRAEVTGANSTVDTEALWWPPGKIVGRYLTPFLADHLGLSESLPHVARANAVPVEVELDRTLGRPTWSPV